MSENTEETPGVGHNSEGDAVQEFAADRLRSFIERVERLEEEKAALATDIREVYSEAKATGFDTKIMRIIIKLRKMDKSDREAQDHLVELYCRALDL